jgi:hypothetical protein
VIDDGRPDPGGGLVARRQLHAALAMLRYRFAEVFADGASVALVRDTDECVRREDPERGGEAVGGFRAAFAATRTQRQPRSALRLAAVPGTRS